MPNNHDLLKTLTKNRSWRAGLVVLVLFFLFFGAGWYGVAQEASSPVKLLDEEALSKIPDGGQPIRFSHQIHAEKVGLDCQYCHSSARKSSVAGIPPVSVCAGCHQYVQTQLSEVAKVMEYWNNKEPIPWVKVHDVPDFVYFSHEKHLNAKNERFPEGVACQDCHGSVEKSHVMKLETENFGDMGWCLECHLTVPGALERKRGIPEAPGSTKLSQGLNPHGLPRANLTDCLTCHK